ncbi:MAG: hypothetical protein MHMPM18_001761 [Marteilia pararefringens]
MVVKDERCMESLYGSNMSYPGDKDNRGSREVIAIKNSTDKVCYLEEVEKGNSWYCTEASSSEEKRIMRPNLRRSWHLKRWESEMEI